MRIKQTLLLVLMCACMATAQTKPTPGANKKLITAKDTVPAIVFAQVHMAATFINVRFAMDSIKDKWMDTYFIARMSGCVAQQMAFGVIWNEKECTDKIAKHKEYLRIFCPTPQEEFERQIRYVYRVVKKNWQPMLNHAITLQLNEEGASWVLDHL